MKLQPRARAGIALMAAYTVAVQALLLAVIAPAAAVAGISAGVAALPICARAASSSAQPDDGQAGQSGQPGQVGHAGHGQDCLDACLTGCCCGAPLVPLPAGVSYGAPKPLQMLAPESETHRPILLRAAKAHRSRAPPAA
jgi:hypothetical protein